MRTAPRYRLSLCLLAGFSQAAAGCGGSGAGASGSGGVPSGSGGVTETGGVVGSGGTTGGGGIVGSGGRPGSGGVSASGGVTGTAGHPAGGTGAGLGSGGMSTAIGGKGGTPPTGSGGKPGSGGAVATGGALGSGGAPGLGGAIGSGALIHNDSFWKDTAGNTIYSQGGGAYRFNGTYYWYGVKYNGAVTYAAKPTKQNSDTSFAAVTCYSSNDLVTWKHEADVLTADGLNASVMSSSWVGRMGVVYNANTKKYVLITQYQGAAGSGELFATSSSPTGTFTYDHVQATVTNVANMTTGDQTVFVDDDGAAYLICSSSSGRSNLYVAPIRASDSLNIEPAVRIFGGAGREGNAMFKYNGMYYFCSSDLHGWNASHSYYIAASNIMGPYGAEGVIGNTDADFSHVSQTGFFFTVVGASGTTVIFAGDRWSDFAGNGLGYNQWCPLTFKGATPSMASVSSWSLDAAAGTWAVGPANNYALNPSFEADRVAMTQPAGWTTSTTTSGATPYTNVSGGHTGNWAWQLGGSSASQATLDQTVTGLPAGTYTLSVWAKSTGGQATANLYATPMGGTEKDAPLTKAMTGWTQVSVEGIAVANGQGHVGVTTTASANQTVTLDDFVFVRTGP